MFASTTAAVNENDSRDGPKLTERALVLSRVLERQTRKHSISRRVSSLPAISKLVPTPLHKAAYVLPVRESSSIQPLPAPVVQLKRRSRLHGFWALRHRLFLLFHDATSSYEARCVSIFLLFAVAVSIIVYIIQTQPDLDPDFRTALQTIELGCIYLFSVDFAVRFVCTSDYKAFLHDPFNWIDCTSVLPHYLEVLVDSRLKGSTSLSAIRTLRLLRVARILKLSRYTSSLHIFLRSLTLSATPLFMLVFLMGIATIVFSSALYFAELTDPLPNFTPTTMCRNPTFSKTCHPNVNPSDDCCDVNPFNSIPATFWWCVVSMTTVGYGDEVPVTPAGKTIASLAMIAGMLILSLPISVIGANFQRVMKEFTKQALKENIDSVANMDVLRRAEMVEVLRAFEVVGENIDIDPDELIALYDLNHSGALEDDELANFRNDLADLQSAIRNHQAHILSPAQELRVKKLSFGGSFDRGTKFDVAAEHAEKIEQMVETRLLESEVRMEAKLTVLNKALVRLQAQLELLGD
ncbi:hypothetical protein LEN26_001200 [Aphanomyces euteiches]|nr:hypothetical protein LEN26_001200 [Aphanomyces euteiches]